MTTDRKMTGRSRWNRSFGIAKCVITLAVSLVAVAAVVNLSNRVMMISKKKNSKTVYARALSKMSRTHKGKPVMSIKDKDGVVRLVVLET